MSDTPRTDAAIWDEHDPAAAVGHLCRELERDLTAANAEIARLKARGCARERIRRLEEAAAWTPVSTKPEGYERPILVWVVWPQRGWPEAKVGWWKHGPGCFAFDEFENADHLVTHWMEISDPTAAKEAKP